MIEIKFRLRFENVIVGYEKWYSGDRVEFKAKPCWLYSTDNEYWNPSYIKHAFKDQHVGLKDKNGREIYEGDIVKDNGGNIWEVYFDQCSFWKNKGLQTILLFPNHKLSEYEVIGNIYENPELMSAKKTSPGK